MYKVYGDYRSGNCYKIKLAMSLLGIDYQWVPVDILKGETQTPEFLAKNPNGKIPVLELEDGSCLWESNAILNFLADGSALLPSEPRLRTQVLQWQFFEQYSHEPYVAVARFIKLYLGLPEAAAPSSKRRRSAATRPSTSWRNSCRARHSWSANSSPSPISPSTPTPMSPMKAAST